MTAKEGKLIYLMKNGSSCSFFFISCKWSIAAVIFSNEGFYLALWGTFKCVCAHTAVWCASLPATSFLLLCLDLSCMSKQKKSNSSDKVPVSFLILKVNSVWRFINPKLCVVRRRTFTVYPSLILPKWNLGVVDLFKVDSLSGRL